MIPRTINDSPARFPSGPRSTTGDRQGVSHDRHPTASAWRVAESEGHIQQSACDHQQDSLTQLLAQPKNQVRLSAPFYLYELEKLMAALLSC